MTSDEKLYMAQGKALIVFIHLPASPLQLQAVAHQFVELLLVGQWYHNALPHSLTHLNMTAQYVVEQST